MELDRSFLERVDKRIDELRRIDPTINEAEILRRANLNKGYLSNLRLGKKSGVPRLPEGWRLARALQWSLSQLYEGETSSRFTIPITAVYDGGDVLQVPREGEEQFVPTLAPTDDLASVRVRSDNWDSAGYRRGDLLVGEKTRGEYAGNLIEKDCIIESANGRRFVGTLVEENSPGRFTIRLLYPREKYLKNQIVSWVAPITMIFRD